MKKFLAIAQTLLGAAVSRVRTISFRRIFTSIRHYRFRNAPSDLKGFCLTRYRRLRAWVIATYENSMARYHSLEPRRQNRVVVLVLSLVFIGDYLMICYHTGRNPLGIFPSIPVLDFRKNITVYLPSPEGTILKEKRLVQKNESTEEYIKVLTKFVIDGSAYENTRLMSPIQGSVRKVWIKDSLCAIDLRLEQLDDDAPLIPGSEKLFREALARTVMENVHGISQVIVLENGIPNKNIWDTASR